jgi:hypothetical protein
MRRLTLLPAFVAAALLASGCSGSNISQQAGLDAAGQASSSDAQIVDTPVDAGSPADTGTATQLPDASPSDAATTIQDPDATLADAATPVQLPDAAPPADAATLADVGDFDGGVITVPLSGFGAISGSCGVLTLADLTDSSPHYFENHLDFGTTPYNSTHLADLTPGGQTLETTPNAGGSSQESETFAFEVLDRCELATLLKTETEIVYSTPGGKITDFLADIEGVKIGVSVTRAESYPLAEPYSLPLAKALMDKKLQGVIDSTANVSASDKWTKQILFVLAYDQAHADFISAAYQQETATLQSNTIVIVTITDGADMFLY